MALMSAFVDKIVLSDSQFAKLTGGKGGEVHDYCVDGGKAIAQQARIRAPKRTGHLARTIRARTVRANAVSTTVQVRCTAFYAEYVHEGTGGRNEFIWGDGPVGGMRLYTRPDNKAGAMASGHGDWYDRWILVVRAQEANPFMSAPRREWYAWQRAIGVIR